MKISISGALTLAYIILCISIPSLSSAAATSHYSDNFLKCFCFRTNLPNKRSSSNPNSNVTLTKTSSSYASILQSSARNLRFSTTSTPKPEVIVLPTHKSHIQAAVICSRKNGLAIRVRSGGHDYEGLSYYSSQLPFIIVDLSSLRSIAVDVRKETAWVESGATLGELYHEIAQNSKVLGFPAGSCPTVGVGGHLSGGGFGTIFRKFGLAADNVIDAKIVDVNGRILDRNSMGEDLFWAIRGGGGASFGVIFAWKLKLVSVPSIVTVFGVGTSLEQGASELLHKWQNIAHELHEDLFLHAIIGVDEKKTIRISFESLFLGSVDKLLPMMEERFPELGVQKDNCTEMSWIESVLHFAGFSSRESSDVLLNRTQGYKSFFKAKSDYVKEPISETGLEGLWRVLLEDEAASMILSPYGGKMSEISDSDTPFPHRKGNMYKIQYTVSWEAEEETEKHISWMRRLYSYMTPYVSKSPRSAYLNYRDLDLGTNNNGGNTSFAQASVWGLKYFNNNFFRLARVKTKVDPSNFFKNEQSIPLLAKRAK